MPTSTPSTPETIYRFRFTAGTDGAVDVWVRLCIDDPSGQAPLGWIGEENSVDVGPTTLSVNRAARVLEQLEHAVELVTAHPGKPDDDASLAATPARTYRFRFAPRDHGIVDTTVCIRIDAHGERKSSDWLSEDGTTETRLARLSDDDATRALDHLGKAIEVIALRPAQSHHRAPTQDMLEHDKRQPLARPSEVRIRR